MHAAPAVDEEHFRLLTGFNDIFVSIAVVLLLVALGQIGISITPALGGLFVAIAAWGLAEYFTARRRMALPSILLLLAFVGGVAGTLAGLTGNDRAASVGADRRAGRCGRRAGDCGRGMAHWRRFMVPITVAAGAAAIVATGVALALAAFRRSAMRSIRCCWSAGLRCSRWR